MICPNCKKDRHVKTKINGTLMSCCFYCGVYSEIKEEPKNTSEKYGGTTIISGWKQRDWGTGLK